MNRSLILTLSVVAALVVFVPATAQAQDGPSFGVFYNSLSAYGDWLHVDGGVYAWRPNNVMDDWRPYYHGRWLWSDDGWYWWTDEPWGWATYHYGRWYDDDYYGWVWIPGNDWAPAWVDWRCGDGYMGWAPLGPYAMFSVSWGIHYGRPWNTPLSYWTFIDCRHVGDPWVQDHAYGRNETGRLIGHTRGAGSVREEGGRIVTRGPGREYIERIGNTRVMQADIVGTSDRPGERFVQGNGRGRVETYRPRLSAGNGGESARPARVRETERSLGLDLAKTDVQRRSESRQNNVNADRLQRSDNSRAASVRERTAARQMRESRNASPQWRTSDTQSNGRNQPINRPSRSDIQREYRGQTRMNQAPATRSSAPQMRQNEGSRQGGQGASSSSPNQRSGSGGSRSSGPSSRSGGSQQGGQSARGGEKR